MALFLVQNTIVRVFIGKTKELATYIIGAGKTHLIYVLNVPDDAKSGNH